jgi:hypothetical protein
MKTRMKTAISLLGVFQLGILALLFVSFDVFVNFETAFFSALLVILGSIYSYRSLVMKQVASAEVTYQEDAIDRIEDPFDLYDEESAGETQEGAREEVDFKTLIKEEKQRLKSSKKGVENMKKSAPAMISVYRLVPYGILALGFVALKNNGILALWPYLLGLGVGVLGGLLMARTLFIKKN